MSEAIMVLKTFLFSILLLMLLQVKIGGSSLEAKTNYLATKSSLALYLQSAAAGGALAIRNFSIQMKSTITGTVDSYKQGASEQRASH